MTGRPRTIADFAGRWHFTREISDKREGRTGRVEGIVDLTSVAGGLDYFETGELVWDGQPPLTATKAYLWRAPKCPTQIAVAHADGRPCHPIDLTRTMPNATHVCGEDLYNVTYSFTCWPAWRFEWHVLGPRKDYRSSSRLVRADARVAAPDDGLGQSAG